MRERNTPPHQEIERESVAWNKLPWRKFEQHCFRIQKRIYRAKQAGKTRAVQKLQKLLMKSEAARLLAVRKVTQDNRGKKTAGVDGVKSVRPAGRFVMANHIHPKNWKATSSPVRRVCYGYVDTWRSQCVLHNEPKAIMKTSPRFDQVQILLRERVVASNLSIGEISWDLGQGMTLLGGQIGRGS